MRFLPIFIFFIQITPNFSDYPTDCEEFQKASELQQNELPQLENVFQNVELQWDRGTNSFACKYYIVEWGCGTGCQMNAIFDQETGEFLTSLNTTMGCEYRANSNLLKVSADPLHDKPDKYYLFEDGKLKPLKRP
ncbi:MAG: hypothetical protein JXQ96_24065 [Cyclobacteriaceae bacterium]